MAYTPKPSLPITINLLLDMHILLDPHNVTHVVFWSLFTLAFFSMARKSNLVVTKLCLPVKCLKRQDILRAKNVLLVRFLWSKTNQFAK